MLFRPKKGEISKEKSTYFTLSRLPSAPFTRSLFRQRQSHSFIHLFNIYDAPTPSPKAHSILDPSSQNSTRMSSDNSYWQNLPPHRQIHIPTSNDSPKHSHTLTVMVVHGKIERCGSSNGDSHTHAPAKTSHCSPAATHNAGGMIDQACCTAWLCCRCSTQNTTAAVFCWNCTHYTINCRECFSY
jgi:hypothetical protein